MWPESSSSLARSSRTFGGSAADLVQQTGLAEGDAGAEKGVAVERAEAARDGAVETANLADGVHLPDYSQTITDGATDASRKKGQVTHLNE
jgi:hypothetical protein